MRVAQFYFDQPVLVRLVPANAEAQRAGRAGRGVAEQAVAVVVGGLVALAIDAVFTCAARVVVIVVVVVQVAAPRRELTASRRCRRCQVAARRRCR